ncbi:hypothetical protein CHELA1G2_13129 [Hyphomicrobiales bacterium]|nr:hypothetical protein CHELA1G2_13129 [Hyphomicrobiales bacterium]
MRLSHGVARAVWDDGISPKILILSNEFSGFSFPLHAIEI